MTASRQVGGAVVRTRCKTAAARAVPSHRHELDSLPVDLVINARSQLRVGAMV